MLLLCLGDICRASVAEAVLRARATTRGLAVAVDSAGTGARPLGAPPDPRMQRAAARAGPALSALRARPVGRGEVVRFDRIRAMDRQSLRDLQARRPPGAKVELRPVLSHLAAHAPGCDAQDGAGTDVRYS